MQLTRQQQPLLVWGIWMLLAAFLRFGPPSIAERLEICVLDAAGQSLKWIDCSHDWIVQSWKTAAPSSRQVQFDKQVEIEKDTVEKLIALQQQQRDLEATIALLQTENAMLKSIPGVLQQERQDSLQQTVAVTAHVLGSQQSGSTGTLRLLYALGKRQGIVGDELILQGSGVLLDAGSHSHISTDQIVSIGRSLYGRTIEVGPWTSLVQPLTDPEFRTAVQLVRHSEFGAVSGGRGILKGTGDSCEMIEVVGTEPVAVGDLVYTDPLVSPTATPIYCGHVIHASIDTNAPHWTIRVVPLIGTNSLPRELTVLRTELRLAGTTTEAR